MENYFPVHDRQAALDGEMMFQYINGGASAEALSCTASRADALMKKYILIQTNKADL
ncbi:MAG: hypothetical protein IJC98_08945 [Clostridia bacterium]|nr:hypothetical protein [Clostridia bacterium]